MFIPKYLYKDASLVKLPILILNIIFTLIFSFVGFFIFFISPLRSPPALAAFLRIQQNKMQKVGRRRLRRVSSSLKQVLLKYAYLTPLRRNQAWNPRRGEGAGPDESVRLLPKCGQSSGAAAQREHVVPVCEHTERPRFFTKITNYWELEKPTQNQTELDLQVVVLSTFGWGAPRWCLLSFQ